MRDKLIQVAVLCSSLLFIAGYGGGGEGGKKKQQRAQQKPAAQKPAAQKPAAKKPAAKKPQPAADAQSNRRREERQARTHITSAYPQTRHLLNYLRRTDAPTYRSLLAHSAKLTRRRQNEVLRFAREHHPELARLVVRLRRKHPWAYNSAIRDLLADHARLLRAKQRSDAEYEVALTEWKLRSQVRLVAARVSVANQPEFQKQLTDLLTQGEAAKRRQIQMQIERYKQQIERLEKRLAQDPEQRVKRQLRTINRRAKPKAKKTDRRRK